MSKMLDVNRVSKVYTTRNNKNKVEALKDVTFSVEPGEYVAIMGESGSGKSTLLNILATLDNPTSGDVVLEDKNLKSIPQSKLATFRRKHLGFVFQDFNLLDTLSVKDNIFLPLVLSKVPLKEMERRLPSLANELGLTDLLEKFPYEISGGQKQRVAVARSLITRPNIILADEPTGALDSKSSKHLLDLFEKVNETGQTILMVTHSAKAASRASRVLFIKDGVVFHQLYKGDVPASDFFKEINDTMSILLKEGE
ncbi:MAG: ABC transporter ATP-binding protein [Lachnospiraceae bacterium]|nr:ABC transporter ATP-binding protein [Lachnospiraceae bacterium]